MILGKFHRAVAIDHVTHVWNVDMSASFTVIQQTAVMITTTANGHVQKHVTMAIHVNVYVMKNVQIALK